VFRDPLQDLLVSKEECESQSDFPLCILGWSRFLTALP
jgi:hypothetical protein